MVWRTRFRFCWQPSRNTILRIHEAVQNWRQKRSAQPSKAFTYNPPKEATTDSKRTAKNRIFVAEILVYRCLWRILPSIRWCCRGWRRLHLQWRFDDLLLLVVRRRWERWGQSRSPRSLTVRRNRRDCWFCSSWQEIKINTTVATAAFNCIVAGNRLRFSESFRPNTDSCKCFKSGLHSF